MNVLENVILKDLTPVRVTPVRVQLDAIKAELKNLKLQLARTKANPACFVAGTLIHTKNGLVPIEQIKVGDWVLSQPEDKGELSYKPVTRTFVHESNDLWLISFGFVIEKNGQKEYFSDEIVTTGGHPFFSTTKGWINAVELTGGGHIKMVDGNEASATYMSKIFQMEDPNVGHAPRDPGGEGMRDEGYGVDFTAAGYKVEHRRRAPEAAWDFDYNPMVRTVYNFEVADNHTYYIGTLGLWVHNTKSVPVLVQREADLIDGSQPGRTSILKEQIQTEQGVPTPAAVMEKSLPGYEEFPGLNANGFAEKATQIVEFKNPWAGKANFKSFDGRAKMPDDTQSTLWLDAKNGLTTYRDAFDPSALPGKAQSATNKLAEDLAELSEVIKQARAGMEPDMAVLWIVGDETGLAGREFIDFAKEFVANALRDGSRSTINGVSNPNWFSEHVYFGQSKPYQIGTTMELPDTAWRYSYAKGTFEEVSVTGVLKPASPASAQDLLDGLNSQVPGLGLSKSHSPAYSWVSAPAPKAACHGIFHDRPLRPKSGRTGEPT
ncbi:MAG: polymorphic toxin-type HINT domain-containing protein [Thiobacillus sp.]